jgi:integrase
MARTARPWCWSDRHAWFVNRDGHRHLLGPHPVDAPAPEKTRGRWNVPPAILQKFHELMAAPPVESAETKTASGLSVAGLFDRYLDWCQKHRSPRTYAGYLWHLQRFAQALPDATTLAAIDLKPFHLVEWLDAHPDWGPTYRRNAIAAVKRAYAWAEELGYLSANPVRTVKKPTAKRRERFVSPEDWAKIRDSYNPSNPFRQLLEFVWETGCRPFEARRLEVRHVHLDRAVIAIPPEEAKGRKKWRLIRLEGRALEIVTARLAVVKTGPVFLNADGVPWTSSAMACRFGRLEKKLGVRHFAYAFRHGFANRLLVSGVDHLTVAELLGHADGTMLAKVYQHLDQSDAHLRAALRQAAKATTPERTSDL